MSIFDTLRYPLGNIDTSDQLTHIPLEILEAWVKHPEFDEGRPGGTVPEVRATAASRRDLLKKIILEWP